MSEIEIALARAYLQASEQDPVAALIRSVRDLAATRALVSAGYVRGNPPGLRPIGPSVHACDHRSDPAARN